MTDLDTALRAADEKLHEVLKDLAASMRSVGREFEASAAKWRGHRDAPSMFKLAELCNGWADVIEPAVKACAAQDAELTRISAELHDQRWQHAQELKRAEQAERERDAFREKLLECQRAMMSGHAC